MFERGSLHFWKNVNPCIKGSKGIHSMGRFFVIGDIHACPQELEDVITACALEREDHVVFLGDYIDRGPGACEVVAFLLVHQAVTFCTLTFLKRNHEDMLLDLLSYSV